MSARSALIALVVLAVAAPPVIAQEDGVFVDPDSPAGKEYAVPLDQARREASGAPGSGTRGGGTAESDGDQPLFGVGIEPSSSGGAGAGGAKGSGGSGAGGGSGGSGGSSDGTQVGAGQAARSGAIEAAASGGTSTGLLTAGIAVAVLMLGLLGGLGLRRVLRDG